MELFISNGVESKDKSSHIFNIFTKIEPGLGILSSGWRYKEGAVNPPGVVTKRGYIQTQHVTKDFIKLLYEELRVQGWAKDVKDVNEFYRGEVLDEGMLKRKGF